jgi:hypothetical protein
MRKSTRPLLLAATLALPLPTAALGDAEAVAAREGGSFEVSLEVVGRYLWRSYDLNHADPSLLAYLTWSPGAVEGLSLSVGAIAGLRNDAELGDDSSDVDEIDLTIAWEHELIPEVLTFSASVLYYDYTSTWTEAIAYEDDEDLEVSLGLAWTLGAHFAPALTYYRGLDDGIQGNYVEIGAAFPFELGEAWSLEPSVTAGWSDQYDEDPRFTNYVAALPLTWSGETLSVTVAANLARIDDPESSNPADLVGEKPEDDLAWAAVDLTWSF